MSLDYSQLTKGNVVSGAFSRIGISAITADLNPEDMALGLTRLEDMAHEFNSRNMDANYNFTTIPDPNDEIGVFPEFKEAYETLLAVRLAPDFELQPNALLVRQSDQAVSNLSARTAQNRQTNYPNRQPRGSGNTLRYFPWSRFYRNPNRAPITAPILRIGNVNDYVESWASYLQESETITAHEITPDEGLVVVSSSIDNTDIRFRLRADEDDESDVLGAVQVDIEITTSTGRINSRRVYFNTSR